MPDTMNEMNKQLRDLLAKTLKLQSETGLKTSRAIRDQLMLNREKILAFHSRQQDPDFDPQLLEELTAAQAKLETEFKKDWIYKVPNPYGLLKFDRVYGSQTYVVVDWHASHAFHHLHKSYFKFDEHGFFNLISAQAQERHENIISRMHALGPNYSNTYTVDDKQVLKFKIPFLQFEGTIIDWGIVGKNIKLGAYGDGRIPDMDEILSVIS
jgi:hypothetical protein